MRRFRSRFGQIQRLREQCERLAKAHVTSTAAELAAARSREQLLLQNLQELQLSAAAELQRNMTGSFLNSVQHAVESAEDMVAAAGRQRSEAEDQVIEALRAFQTASTELKTVNHLVDNEQSRHRRMTNQITNHQISEQATHAWHGQRAYPTDDDAMRTTEPSRRTNERPGSDSMQSTRTDR